MKKVRAIIAALAVAFAGTVMVGASPAQANHDNDFGHWNQPPLVVNATPGVWDDIIQDAAYYWQDNAFYRGYYPPLPHNNGAGCVAFVGTITVCIVDQYSYFLNYGTLAGKIEPKLYNDGSGHIESMYLYISSALTGYERQLTMRHEFGHALGLGHYDRDGTTGHVTTCTIMNTNPCGLYGTLTDFRGIWSWQPQGYQGYGEFFYHNQH